MDLLSAFPLSYIESYPAINTVTPKNRTSNVIFTRICTKIKVSIANIAEHDTDERISHINIRVSKWGTLKIQNPAGSNRCAGIRHYPCTHSGMKALRGAGRKMFPTVPNDYSLRNVVPYIYMRPKSRMSERPR